jgi:hypothetical protein
VSSSVLVSEEGRLERCMELGSKRDRDASPDGFEKNVSENGNARSMYEGGS